MIKRFSKCEPPYLMESLRNSGFLTNEPSNEPSNESSNESIGEYILNSYQKQEIPLFLRIVTGLGAFISSIFFIFFILFSLAHSSESTIFFGVFLVFIAIIMEKRLEKSITLDSYFFKQVALTLIVIGNLLLIFGLSYVFDNWLECLVYLIVICISYPLYRVSAARFFMAFSLLCFILWNIGINNFAFATQEILLNIFIFLQCVGLVILFCYDVIKRSYIPLTYAFIFSLCVNILYLILSQDFRVFDAYTPVYFFLPNIILSFWLIALLISIARGVKNIKYEPFILAFICVILLAIISTPGIIFALGLLVFGYAKQEKALSIIAILFMILFLVLYYYSLNVSLLNKSFILMGSGSVLLLGRFYLKYRAWDKVGAPCDQK